MNRIPKICLSSQVTRGHLMTGLAAFVIVLFTGLPLFGQVTPEQRLTEAYRLEKEGKASPAITQLTALLDSKSLDQAGMGRAWNILGLAYEDQGALSESRHAFEQSLQAYEGLSNAGDLAMALDDFGELYALTGQFDLAVRMMERALHLYESVEDHAGVARASSYLAGALFGQKKIREGKENLTRALKESRLTDEHSYDDLAALASLQGWLAQREGDIQASVSNYQQSLDLLRKNHGEESMVIGWAYALLGQARAETGDLSRSLTEMDKGRVILGSTLNNQDPRVLATELAYARVLDRYGRRSEAASIRANAESQWKTRQNTQCLACTVSAKAFR